MTACDGFILGVADVVEASPVDGIVGGWLFEEEDGEGQIMSVPLRFTQPAFKPFSVCYLRFSLFPVHSRAVDMPFTIYFIQIEATCGHLLCDSKVDASTLTP